MPRTRPPYPPEFRQEAVRLVRSSGKPIVEVARELGIAGETLRSWVKQAQVDAGDRPGLSTAESARIRQLERENAELRRANAILRTASAFFASMSG